MKNRLTQHVSAVLSIALLSILNGCNIANMVEPAHPGSTTGKMYRSANTHTLATGDVVQYADSIIYMRPGVNVAAPVRYPNRAGSYTATPLGLSINAQTGEVNMVQSESGMWFTVTFTPTDGSTPCKTRLMISGIEYKEGIYRLSEQHQLVPYYNGSTSYLMPSGNFRSNSAQLAINATNGSIDLRQTGLSEGQIGMFIINYRLDDASIGAANAIRLQIHRYRTLADVPPGLLARLQRNTGGRTEGDMAIQEEAKERPPVVVVVSN